MAKRKYKRLHYEDRQTIGIDSRGRIPERLRRCNGRYAKEKRAEATAGAGKESPPLVFH